MTFTLLPAIDVSAGRAVRPGERVANSEAALGDPRDIALAWQSDGAEWIHLVDLDAAFGRGSNSALLAAVIGALDVKVQLSGGIGDDASLERALDTGCDRVNVGTAALWDAAWCARVVATHGERVAIGLDVRVDGQGGSKRHRLAPRGATREAGDLWEMLARLDRDGCTRYVVTDVSRDGTLSGPNLELYREITGATSAPVVTSGGISSLDDLRVLADTAASTTNLEGAIVGSALHAGRFTLREALELLR